MPQNNDIFIYCLRNFTLNYPYKLIMCMKTKTVTSQFSLLSLLPFSSSLRMKEASMDNNNLHLIGKYIYRVDSVEHINTENNFIASLLQLQADNNNTTAYLLTFADMDEEMRWKKLCVLRRVCGSHRHLAF